MKLTAILSLLAVTPVALAASLDKKACTPSECICINGQGQFCGNEAINPACTNGHVFECNKDTGKTCDYGVRDSCVKCGELQC